MPSTPPGPLLTVRAAVVLLIALIIGVIASCLAYLADNSVPSAVLCGGGAAGGSLLLFHTIIGR
ncbi:hypothetical protein ABZ738_04635 [Micromonospora sp. NPDC047793]|uniref:hypothetical protein n=1 Tax=Micromonospora sp. NPDC047793 TaxID=3154342 RepID=UPI0033ED3D65